MLAICLRGTELEFLIGGQHVLTKSIRIRGHDHSLRIRGVGPDGKGKNVRSQLC